MVRGEKELSPIEAWFFSQNFQEPGHYNQSVLLEFKRKVDVGLLEAAFQQLIKHHDGLRLNHRSENNRLFYNDSHLEIIFTIQDLGTISRKNGNGQGWDFSIFSQLKNQFELADKLLLQAGIVREQEGGDFKFLCISVHHLLIDGISWRILLEDLYNFYQALEKEQPLVLPPKTASLLDWQQALTVYAQSEKLAAEIGYWEQVKGLDFYLPLDTATDDWRTLNRMVMKSSLDEEQTSFLLKEAHQTYKTDVPILLNTALALALKNWTNQSQLLIEQENHGRHLEGIDVSRTLGWFTALYPVLIKLEEQGLGAQIQAVKEQMRQVPGKGLGYGVLKYLRTTVEAKAATLTEVRMNYLGQFGSELDNDWLAFRQENTGEDHGPGNRMTAKLECNLMVVNGLLHLEIYYNQLAHQPSSIKAFEKMLLKYLLEILDHIRKEEGIHLSPSDFDTVEIDQEELDALFE